MKKAVLAVVVLLCFGFSFNASAQLSKKEKKEWKKQMKDLDVEAFKKLVEEKESFESQVASLNSQVSSLQARANEKTTEADRLKSEMKDLQNQLAEAKAGQQEANNMDISGKSTRVVKGVAFKVQIGAFRNKDLTKYFENNGSFDGEVDNTTQRYTLGTFTDYWEADKFKKYLREMGVKDAWIVAYKDGQRVPLKDVLEGVI